MAVFSIGILASGLNFSYLSNPFVFKGLFRRRWRWRKIHQLIKNKPLLVKDYVITYTNDTLIGKARHYDIQFKQEEVTPHPRCLLILCYPTKRCIQWLHQGSSLQPDTRHYAAGTFHVRCEFAGSGSRCRTGAHDGRQSEIQALQSSSGWQCTYWQFRSLGGWPEFSSLTHRYATITTT